MSVEQVNSFDDPRVAAYRNLKDRELAREGDLFIAEGQLVVRRLLRSPYPCLSVMCVERKLEAVRADVPPDVPVYVVPDAVVHRVVGYHFHTGVMGVGRRLPPAPLGAVLPGRGDDRPLTVVVLPNTNNLENLGSIARLCAGFGVDALVLGEECADPFYRQAVRISMGTMFSLPLVRSDDVLRDLGQLRDEWGVELMATVLDESAEPVATTARPRRLGLLFGSEAMGLSAAQVRACQRRVTIPMSLGTDSLNVSMSAAIFLYHFTRLATVPTPGGQG